MTFITEDNREFQTKEEAIYWENNKKELPVPKLGRKPRSDKNTPRNKYNKNLPKEYISYIRRANKKQIDFELSLEEFQLLTNSKCTYCGNIGKLGIDRIDSSKGYIKSNCSPCCFICNMMKYIHTVEQFYSHIEKILKYRDDNAIK